MTGFETRHVIVTGGGGGIGSATVRRFVAQGAHVSVFDRDLAGATRVADAVTEAGGTAKAFACDITDRPQVEQAVAAAIDAFGPVAVLVNNAGWDIFRPFLKTTPEEWQQLIAINLVGALHMHHVVLPGMVEQRYGRIINIASDAARVGSSGEAVYAACKAGLVALSKTLAREHARHSITVNVVCPGPTDTALFADYKEGAGNPEKLVEAFRRSIPLGRIGEPEDLPGAIVFFASDAASFVTGQVLSVSGGLSMAG
ncbi:glucose 1-dehydrogenase [Sphingomonas sp. BE270]|jgi:2-hydroxycyclohexanecarboxyl-CoA dehydrogenase|uniref:glucose 1-dehydrogenase n=1 Tax=Sphingomonas sp. BE270 TaxID=2817726 RepID=UPI00286D2593|nr:glucose 1-dehydrogenase [Sphingomonas sp. BE270]